MSIYNTVKDHGLMLGNFSSQYFLNLQGTDAIVVVYKIVVILVVVVVVVIKLVMSFPSRSDVSLQASKVWCFSQMAFFFSVWNWSPGVDRLCVLETEMWLSFPRCDAA